jgi:uncharacterized protein with HEPN domain
MKISSSEGRRGDVVRVADIEETTSLLDGIRLKGRDAFLADPYLQAAAVRYLEIIGEAAGHLSSSFRSLHPAFPVRQMRGFASFAKHEYWRIKPELVWSAVHAMPTIRKALGRARAANPARRRE